MSGKIEKTLRMLKAHFKNHPKKYDFDEVEEGGLMTYWDTISVDFNRFESDVDEGFVVTVHDMENEVDVFKAFITATDSRSAIKEMENLLKLHKNLVEIYN